MNRRPGLPPTYVWLPAVSIFTLVWFVMLGLHDLVRPDEGRYAEIAREMVATGDWLTPRLNGIKYFEKPALQYWATAAAFEVFGFGEWSARLWAGLTGFLGIVTTWFAGARLFGPRTALFAAIVLASTLLYALIGHFNTLDMGVSFFLSAAVFSFALAQRDDATRNEWRGGMAATWLLLAAAMLSKGLIGLVLPGATLVAYLIWQRDWGLVRRLWLLPGLALFLAVSVPWFVAVSRANPEFFHFFFIHEHFERFLTKAHGRYQPPWYFVPVLLAGFLPWTTALFPALARAFRRDEGRRFQPDRLLLVWIVVVFGFFSVSGSKLASYILPLFPAAALLVGRLLDALPGSRIRWHGLLATVVGLCLAAFAAIKGPGYADATTPLALYEGFIPWIVVAGTVLAAGGILGFVVFSLGHKLSATLALGATAFMTSLFVFVGHDALSPSTSAKTIANAIRDRIDPAAPFYSVNTYDQTLQPYLGRTTTMVAYQDELGFGIGVEPEKFIPTIDEFERRWRADRTAYALMGPEDFSRLEQAGLPMVVIARDTRRVIVGKP